MQLGARWERRMGRKACPRRVAAFAVHWRERRKQRRRGVAQEESARWASRIKHQIALKDTEVRIASPGTTSPACATREKKRKKKKKAYNLGAYLNCTLLT